MAFRQQDTVKNAKLVQTFEGLEKSLSELEVRNAELRLRAATQLQRLESEGRPTEDLDKDLNKAKKELSSVQAKNAVQAKHLKKQRALLAAQTEESLKLKAELDRVRNACVALQRENLELADNPLIKWMKRSLQNMEQSYGDIVVKIQETQNSQEGMIDRLKPRLAELHGAAQVLWTETSEIASQREEAARLIGIGNARIAEFEQLTKELEEIREKAAFVLSEQDVHITEEKANHEKRVKEAKQIRKEYCQLVIELRCQNRSLHDRMKVADADVVTLREEQERLLESLMCYLLVFQDSTRISSEPAKEILAPLCLQAGVIRSKMPQEDPWQDEPEEEETEIPLYKKPYPSPDGIGMDSWMPKDSEEIEDANPGESAVPLYQNLPPMSKDKSSLSSSSSMRATSFSNLAM